MPFSIRTVRCTDTDTRSTKETQRFLLVIQCQNHPDPSFGVLSNTAIALLFSLVQERVKAESRHFPKEALESNKVESLTGGVLNP